MNANYPLRFLVSRAATQLATVALSAIAASLGFAETAPIEPPIAAPTGSDASQFLHLAVGKSTVLKFASPVTRLSVGNPAVGDVILLGPNEVYVVAKGVGSTNIVIWGKNNESRVVDMTVGIDPAGLQEKLLAVLPGETEIKVQAAGESLVLTGAVSSTVRLEKAIELANAYAGKKVLNFLQIASPQQVMLEVKVAEINRTMGERLGFDFSGAWSTASGRWTSSLLGLLGGGGKTTLGTNLNATRKIAPFAANTADLPQGLLQPTTTPLGSQDGGSFMIDAQKTDGLVKILAEPTLTAISGQEGSFLAGGEILIPVPQPGGTTVLQAKQFGVELRFIPTVLDNGNVHLRVTSAVSSLVSFSPVANTALGASVIVPTLTTRSVSTTVQLREGQSLAIGGLLQDNYRSSIQRFPILGEIPLLGPLFRSSDFQKSKTELLIVVTPRLARPLTRQPQLPTDRFVEPSRARFLLGGQLEGPHDDDAKKADNPERKDPTPREPATAKPSK